MIAEKIKPSTLNKVSIIGEDEVKCRLNNLEDYLYSLNSSGKIKMRELEKCEEPDENTRLYEIIYNNQTYSLKSISEFLHEWGNGGHNGRRNYLLRLDGIKPVLLIKTLKRHHWYTFSDDSEDHSLYNEFELEVYQKDAIFEDYLKETEKIVREIRK